MTRGALILLFCGLLVPAAAQDRPVGFEDAGRLAAAASPELKDARARRALREGMWVLGYRAFLPQLGVSVSEDERLSLISSDSFTKTYTVNLEQLVFDGGRTRASRQLERAELVLFSDQLSQDESALVESALSAYRQLLASRMIIAIRQEALASLGEQRRIMKEELALGMVIALDLVQAEITVKEAELELRSLVLQLENQEELFADLLGLGEMPELSERMDIHRPAFVPAAETVRRLAAGGNPDLGRMLHSIMQKEIEAKIASRTWIPTVKATGSFSLSGQRYPLTRHSWSLGFSVNFSSPWFNAGAGGAAGWEPPYDKTARVQTSLSPLPDPASGLGAKQTTLALVLERENYRRGLEQLGREAALEVNNLALAEKRRALAVEALELAGEKYRLSEVLLSLGRITRIELMEERIELAKKEVEAAEAAAALLEAERTLERFAGVPPGNLRRLAGK
ncbi:MAG: TolC family protein [Spirochaetaceae bacterium]|jgi:outer membrane protein TolC|nr:TolC family protein [Spirochaetaceae bacterium]